MDGNCESSQVTNFEQIEVKTEPCDWLMVDSAPAQSQSQDTESHSTQVSSDLRILQTCEQLPDETSPDSKIFYHGLTSLHTVASANQDTNLSANVCSSASVDTSLSANLHTKFSTNKMNTRSNTQNSSDSNILVSKPCNKLKRKMSESFDVAKSVNVGSISKLKIIKTVDEINATIQINNPMTHLQDFNASNICHNTDIPLTFKTEKSKLKSNCPTDTRGNTTKIVTENKLPKNKTSSYAPISVNQIKIETELEKDGIGNMTQFETVFVKSEPVDENSSYVLDEPTLDLEETSTDDSECYKCPYCFQIFVTAKTLRSHLLLDDRISIKKYKSSNDTINGEDKLPIEMLKVTNSIKTVKTMCNVCKTKHNNVCQLIYHQLKSKHDINIFKCFYCDELFCNSVHIYEHAKNCHKGNLAFSCQGCGNIFDTKNMLMTHLRRAEKPSFIGNKKKSEIVTFCRLLKDNFKVCGYIRLDTKSNVIEIGNISPVPNYDTAFLVCSQCNNYFSNIHYLDQHFVSVHADKIVEAECLAKKSNCFKFSAMKAANSKSSECTNYFSNVNHIDQSFESIRADIEAKNNVSHDDFEAIESDDSESSDVSVKLYECEISEEKFKQKFIVAHSPIVKISDNGIKKVTERKGEMSDLVPSTKSPQNQDTNNTSTVTLHVGSSLDISENNEQVEPIKELFINSTEMKTKIATVDSTESVIKIIKNEPKSTSKKQTQRITKKIGCIPINLKAIEKVIIEADNSESSNVSNQFVECEASEEKLKKATVAFSPAVKSIDDSKLSVSETITSSTFVDIPNKNLIEFQKQHKIDDSVVTESTNITLGKISSYGNTTIDVVHIPLNLIPDLEVTNPELANSVDNVVVKEEVEFVDLNNTQSNQIKCLNSEFENLNSTQSNQMKCLDSEFEDLNSSQSSQINSKCLNLDVSNNEESSRPNLFWCKFCQDQKHESHLCWNLEQRKHYLCRICDDEAFSSSMLLRLHYSKNHTTYDKQKVARYVQTVSAKQRNIASKKIMTVYILQCSICKKEFTHLSVFEEHFQNKHKCEPKYKCIICDGVFPEYDLFKMHLLNHQEVKAYCGHCKINMWAQNFMHKTHLVEAATYSCFFCTENKFRKMTPEQHCKSHLQNIKAIFKCILCNDYYCSRFNISLHMKESH